MCDLHLRVANSIDSFKTGLKTYFLSAVHAPLLVDCKVPL